MRRPTGFTMDNSYVAVDVDVWCPNVVPVSVCVGVLLLGGGGGGFLRKSRRILASISMGGSNLKS